MNKKNAHLVRYAQKNVFKHFRNRSFHAQRSYTLFLFERLLIIPFLVNRFTRQRNRLVKIFLDKKLPTSSVCSGAQTCGENHLYKLNCQKGDYWQ